ncbi:uncharacterized protein A4U43_C03F15490 [Asparagus officinalis]|uniref:CCT domain-containing protein n=1 Tax=Asparagus officinalis TaxID=4686 RepID=A0A5P1FD54_ASPOF|nr:uncharacterized protein A4U43_C03F15490 [Asparagus officinalis]
MESRSIMIPFGMVGKETPPNPSWVVINRKRQAHRQKSKAKPSSIPCGLLKTNASGEVRSAPTPWAARPRARATAQARSAEHAKASAEAVSQAAGGSLVPDLEAENFEYEEEEEEEQLIYRVPIFDPVLEEFCSPATEEVKLEAASVNQIPPVFNELYQSELELAEFSANVENLLGQDLDNDAFCIDGLGLLETKDDDDDKNQVKVEITDAVDSSCGNFLVDMEMELSRESLDFNFDCGSTGEEADEQKAGAVEEQGGLMTKVGLRLDYDAVIDAWSCRGCTPWTDGERPQFNPDDCWPDFTIPNVYGGTEVGGLYGRVGNSDGGREARVSRYREKRRTRLFSKKIRYEVRKLNAEKRPRMKGRFVKRASFNNAGGGGSAAFPYV